MAWLVGGAALLGLLLLAVMGVAVAVGAGGRPGKLVPEVVRGEDTVGDLVEHFRKNGVEGEYQPLTEAFTGVGAIESGTVWNKRFTVHFTIYRFDDVAKAKSLEKTNGVTPKYHRNGRFVIEIKFGEDRVLPIFKKF